MDELTLLSTLCSIPTAPFAEAAVVKFVTGWVKKHRGLTLSRDRDGNLLILRKGTGRLPRTIMVAHMDHPGFIAREMTDAKTLSADFYGYVQSAYFAGSKVRFFTTDGEVAGVVQSATMGENGRTNQAVIRVKKSIPAGSVGMWDVGTGKVSKNKFFCRVCDDLAGAAAGLRVMGELSRKRLKASVGLLLTRAEEEGFIGAIAAVRNKQLLKKTDRVISIECSAEQSYARQGDGMILRAGDRTSIFNSAYTRFLGTRAEKLAKADKSFKFQRALMPGGTCEATVFDAYDYIAAAVCIPLGNYHNMNTAKQKIEAEYVNLDDWRSLVALLADVCENGHAFSGNHADLRQVIAKRFAPFANLLKTSARGM